MMRLNLALLFVLQLAPVEFLFRDRENLLHRLFEFVGRFLRGRCRHCARYAILSLSAIRRAFIYSLTCSTEASFRRISYCDALSIIPFTLNRSVSSIAGKRSWPLVGTSHITDSNRCSLSSPNPRKTNMLSFSVPMRLADLKNIISSIGCAINAAATSSRLYVLADLILSIICNAVSSLGLTKTFSCGVGVVTTGVSVGVETGSGVGLGDERSISRFDSRSANQKQKASTAAQTPIPMKRI